MNNRSLGIFYKGVQLKRMIKVAKKRRVVRSNDQQLDMSANDYEEKMVEFLEKRRTLVIQASCNYAAVQTKETAIAISFWNSLQKKELPEANINCEILVTVIMYIYHYFVTVKCMRKMLFLLHHMGSDTLVELKCRSCTADMSPEDF
ncbi:hypothetical protein PR048_001365 [Dryococelus australis]|uniref:Uncharacterized protein n=1 Tax=Dryococelus australis TaxID=614101 RepID=A0ABQ9IHA0_9NEOP|nr:hypothetical protein PR048_001365 [Dryococelus australis]